MSFSHSSKQRFVGAIVLSVAGFWSAIGQAQTTPQPNTAPRASVAAVPGWARIVARSTGRVAAALYVDGKPVCHLPCQTIVPAGAHRLDGRGPDGNSPEQNLYLAAGSTAPLFFDILPFHATIRVAAENVGTFIYIDGAYVGKGSWQGDVPAGRHVVQMRKPNGEIMQQYLNAAAAMTYSIRDASPTKQPGSQQNTPWAPVGPTQPAPAARTNQIPTEVQDGRYRGITGAAFSPIMLGGASTDTYGSNCPATAFGGSCTTGGPRGGALAFRLGYSYGWIAPEAMVAMSLDMSSAGLHSPSVPGDTNGLLAQVAGGTKFLRLGLIAGGGARLATQAQEHRFTFSGTLGLIKRFIYIIPDSFFGSETSYTAPTLFFDAGVMIGDSPGIKIYAGLFLWVEFAPEMAIPRDVTTLGLDPKQVPMSLQTITPFSGTQLMFGPLVGITFGH